MELQPLELQDLSLPNRPSLLLIAAVLTNCDRSPPLLMVTVTPSKVNYSRLLLSYQRVGSWRETSSAHKLRSPLLCDGYVNNKNI